MSSKYYIDMDNITFDTEVEWGLNRGGRVIDFYKTDVDTYLVVCPYDASDEFVAMPNYFDQYSEDFVYVMKYNGNECWE